MSECVSVRVYVCVSVCVSVPSQKVWSISSLSSRKRCSAASALSQPRGRSQDFPRRWWYLLLEVWYGIPPRSVCKSRALGHCASSRACACSTAFSSACPPAARLIRASLWCLATAQAPLPISPSPSHRWICKVSTALQKKFASHCIDFLQEPVWGVRCSIDGTGAEQVTFQMSRDDCLLYLPCTYLPCTLLLYD